MTAALVPVKRNLTTLFFLFVFVEQEQILRNAKAWYITGSKLGPWSWYLLSDCWGLKVDVGGGGDRGGGGSELPLGSKEGWEERTRPLSRLMTDLRYIYPLKLAR